MNSTRFAGKVAVVTGGASGIGLAIARRLVNEGGRAVLADVNPETLAQVEDELGDQVARVQVDVRAEMAAAAMFLASDDAGYISGSNLFVDGAWETTGYPDLKPFLEAMLAD